MSSVLNGIKPVYNEYYPGNCEHFEKILKAVSKYETGSFADSLERFGEIPSYKDLHSIYWIGEMIAKDRLFDDESPDRTPANMSDVWNFTQGFFRDFVEFATWIDLGVRKDGDNVTFYKGLQLLDGRVEAGETLETSLKAIRGEKGVLNWDSFWGHEDQVQKGMTKFTLGVNEDQQRYLFGIVHGNTLNGQYRLWPKIEIPEDSDEIKVYQLSHRARIGQLILPKSVGYRDKFTGTFGIKKRKVLKELVSEMKDKLVNCVEGRAEHKVESLSKVEF